MMKYFGGDIEHSGPQMSSHARSNGNEPWKTEKNSNFLFGWRGLLMTIFGCLPEFTEVAAIIYRVNIETCNKS